MAQLQWNLNFKRLMDSSLDADYSFDTIKSLKDYLTNPYRYAGQIAYCLENDTLYVLNKTKTKWKEIGKGSDSGIEIVSDYSKLPTTTSDTICYVIGDYIDTSVSPNITYKKGFYLYHDDGVNTPKWELIGKEIETEKEVNESFVYTVTINDIDKNLNCEKTVETVGSETNEIITSKQDSSDGSISVGDVISIKKTINGIVVYEYNILDNDVIEDPFA